jgi:acyl-CoA thioesterase I
MKKIKLIAIFILALVIFSGCAKPRIRNLESKGANIICFGDSITFGYGASPGEDYPTALSKLLKRPVINAGVDGDTTFDALARIDTDVLDKDPRLVIVELGGNDFLQNIPEVDTVKNLAKIVERIQQKGAMVALVDISSGYFFQDYREKYKKLAADKKTIFIPLLLNKIITNPAMKSDFFHPNARGYQIVAQRIYKGILTYTE